MTEGDSYPFRDKFSDLTDEEFIREVRIGEAAKALTPYLQQRATGIGPSLEEDAQFERNPRFPFPLGPTAHEIATLVVDSFGSFAVEASQQSECCWQAVDAQTMLHRHGQELEDTGIVAWYKEALIELGTSLEGQDIANPAAALDAANLEGTIIAKMNCYADLQRLNVCEYVLVQIDTSTGIEHRSSQIVVGETSEDEITLRAGITEDQLRLVEKHVKEQAELNLTITLP